MIKMANLMFCCFLPQFKKNGNESTNKKRGVFLGDEVSILNSVVFRKYRCLTSGTVDYGSVHLDYGLGFLARVQDCESTGHTAVPALSNKSYAGAEKALDPVWSVPLTSLITLDKSHKHAHR